MSYLGRGSNLTRKAQDKVSFLATAGQTVRTGLSYVPTHVDVTVNGITLTEITDYTATNGNSITFTVALALNDEVTIVSSKTFDVANHYTISAANALLAAKAPIASPSFTAKATISIASANGDILDFKSNGSDVGTIGTLGGATYFGSEDSGIMFNGVNQNPTSGGSTRVDNTNDLGAASYRYKNIYLGGGAFLGGTATANKLDDYEIGTFTPSGTGVNTSSSVGIYTKIGRVCHVQIWIIANGNTAGHLGGLPFVSGIGSANYLGVGSVGFQNGTVNSIMTTGNTGGWYMYAANNSAGQLTNGQQMHCSLTYLTV